MPRRTDTRARMIAAAELFRQRGYHAATFLFCVCLLTGPSAEGTHTKQFGPR